ncbi:MAG: hypothetical protein DRQ88_05385 [Epsilonproteobacteria bacterium]|nr:MAG: hypothetical protein DRQ89_08400 [Campylobacterota bacterium]RLA66749.1 MAG: hypothetical protein DRQ88_05385 [Campylobacterota bacterium]
MNSALGEGFSNAQFNRRLQTLKNINQSLAYRVINLKNNCFSNRRFRVNQSKREQILRILPRGVLASLHSVDMEHGASSRRNLDGRSDKYKNSPGRIAIDLVLDLLRNDIANNITTLELIMKIACSSSNLLTNYKLTSHVATSVENKLLRNTGNCWDYAHIAIRLAKELNIPLTRAGMGIHLFVKYRIPDIKNKKIYFYVDSQKCPSSMRCLNDISDPKSFAKSSLVKKEEIINRSMKKEKCYRDAMKRDPNYYIFSDLKNMK